MLQKIKDKIKRKRFTSKYGELVFTFPDGKRLYMINDSALPNIQAKEYRNLQANYNYLSYLGISKSVLNARDKKIVELLEKCMNEPIPQKAHIAECLETINVSNRMFSEFDRATELLMINTFDMFFFFEGENPFEYNEEKLELKKHYLEKYPYFSSFFFQKAKAKYKLWQNSWKESTQFCILSGVLKVMAEEMQLSLQNTPNQIKT